MSVRDIKFFAIWTPLALLWGLGVVGLFNSRQAKAEAPTGLFAEQKTDVIGVRVARVVDTKNGNVCYVATRTDASNSAAISCLGVK